MENEEPKTLVSAKEFIELMHNSFIPTAAGEKHFNINPGDKILKNLRVDEEVCFEGIQCYGGIELLNCEFSKFEILGSGFHKPLQINSCIFRSDFYVINSEFKKTFSLFRSTVANEFNFLRSKVGYSCDIEHVKTIGESRIASNQIDISLKISDFETNDSLDLLANTIGKELYMWNCKISESLFLRNKTIGGSVRVIGTNGKQLYLSETIISGKDISIESCHFTNVTLPELIPDKSTLRIVRLGFTQIEVEEDFTNLGYMQWNELRPMDGAKINVSNAVMGKWDIVNCNFEKVKMQLYSSKITDAFYTNTKFPEKLYVDADIVEKANKQHDILRDGYNQLKTLAQKQNDRKMFLHYQAEELRSFYATLQWWRDLRTKLQLFFMWLSNEFGTNWVRAVFFTASLNLLFLSMAFYGRPLDFSQTWNFVGQYFSFLLALTSKPDFIKSNQEIIAFGVSRIFIAFGIYQTISAFRKFGKGES